MAEMARHWIDGSWVESGVVADSFNPATGELLGSFADGGEAEARAATEAARGAFEVTDWGHDRRLRSRVLLELAELFEARTAELALMLTRENGKTLPQATGEVAAPAATLRHNAAQALIEVAPLPRWRQVNISPVWLSRSAWSRSSCRGMHRWRCSSVPSALRSPPGTRSRPSCPGRRRSPMR